MNDKVMKAKEASQEKLSHLLQLVPELNNGLNQGDMELLIARLSLEKAVAERHINVLADKLIAVTLEQKYLTEQLKKLKGA
jgi:hypothetical protein